MCQIFFIPSRKLTVMRLHNQSIPFDMSSEFKKSMQNKLQWKITYQNVHSYKYVEVVTVYFKSLLFCKFLFGMHFQSSMYGSQIIKYMKTFLLCHMIILVTGVCWLRFFFFRLHNSWKIDILFEFLQWLIESCMRWSSDRCTLR